MHHILTILRAGLLFAVLCTSFSPAVWAGAPDEEPCLPDGFEKDGICGHALAAMRWLERDPLEIDSQILEAQTDIDITHVLLDIELKPDVEQVAGTVTHTVTSLVDGLSQFTLDLRSNMTVDAVQVNGSSASYTRPGHQILISLDNVYDISESFQVAVTYHGLPDDGGFGSFGFDYHGTPSTPIISSLSEPYYASTWWPCKEALVNIDDKFILDIHITVPGNLTAVSNGLLQGTDTLSGSRKRYRWHESYPINVYLVSVAATNYNTVNYTYNYPGGSMPVVLYAYPESLTTAQANTANLVQMIATLSDPTAFGQYPFINEKYGIAQFPWGGGMEHQTITSQGSFSESLNLHELAHQWWGDAVTCKTWHDIWLNEGFATWSEAFWQERKPGGSFTAYKNWMNNIRRPPEGYWGGTVYCYNISSVSTIFNTYMSYRKGAWVVHMLRHVLGDQVFFDTLATYRAMYEDSSATTDDFKTVAEGVSGRDLDWFFNEWVYNGGAPSYRYGWQQQQIGGQNWVRLHVQQYQVSYPLFKMPIDIKINTAGTSQTHSVWHEAQTEWYLLPAPASVISVAFDPDTWILRKLDSIVTYVNGPPKLIGMTPVPGALLASNAAPSQIVLRFSEAITWAASDFSVTGSSSGPVSFIAGYNASDYTVTLTLTAPLPAGQVWTVQVADTLKSQAANVALDGEVDDPIAPSSLPSGDGLPGGAATIGFSVTVTADFDGDGDVDGSDLSAHLLPCLSGPQLPVLPACQNADLDGDGDVDLGDFGKFQRCLSGPGILPALNCAD